MQGYQAYQPQQQQFQSPQAIAPWAQQPVAQVQVPAPVNPPSFEGTALAGTLGAGAAVLATQGAMFLGNVQPEKAVVNAGLTVGMAIFGGTVAALGYRASASRNYNAAQNAMNASGVSPNGAAGALRLNGKLGRWGEMEINIPTQTILDAAKTWNAVQNPQTPDIVHQYFDAAARHAATMAAQGFVQYMPPPQAWCQTQTPQYPPQPMYYQPAPQQGVPGVPGPAPSN